MRLTGNIITGYSDKIYGFAFDKLQDPDKAGDLSQEIMLNLLKIAAKGKEADNMDGFIYTVCRYTFANYLRKKYRRQSECASVDRDGLGGIAASFPSEENIEETAEQTLLRERLMREISRLSKIHRDITVMFYFDNIPSKEIAERLGLSPATVRWYLGESRKKLREGIDMNENLNFSMVKLSVGHDGSAVDFNMHGLGHNPLVSNMAAACREKPLSVEEISREIGVAAAYLEYYLDDLTKMDYMKKIGNRYITNFYIRTPENMAKAANYAYVNGQAPAVTALEALQEAMDDIIAIGFTGSSLDRDSLTWIFYGDLIISLINSAYSEPLDNGRKYRDMPNPIRSDGSAHWVWAAIAGKEYHVPAAEGFAEDFAEYCESCLPFCGVKNRSADNRIFSLQLDYGTGWREFNGEDLSNLSRIRELSLSGAEPGGHDKFIIAKMSKDGYVTVENGKVRLNVPYMTAAEHKKYREIIENICTELGKDFLRDYILGFGKLTEADIPAHLDADTRFYYKYSDVKMRDFLHIIGFKRLLKLPESLKNSAFCTMLYEI